jgi:hypothetical protein
VKDQSLPTLVFIFHDRVQVTIQVDHPADFAFFLSEYRHHLAPSTRIALPTLSLTFRRSWVDGYFPPPGFTSHRHKLIAGWSYRGEIKPGQIELEVVGNQFSVPMIHHMLIHPGLRWLSANQEMLLLHAGAVARDGKSLLITGQGGAGKTTTTSLMLVQGGDDWHIHADDYVFLTSVPQSLAYVTRAHLYSDLLRWVPELRSKLTFPEYLRLTIFGALRRWSREGIKWPLRLPVERIWKGKEIEEVASPATCLILARSPDCTEPSCQRMSVDEIPFKGLIEMNFYEARHFLHLVNKASMVPDFDWWLSEWRQVENSLIRACLAQVPVYRLELPTHFDRLNDQRIQIFDLLASLVDDAGVASSSLPENG